MIGAFANDVWNSVSEEKLLLPTLGGAPVAWFLSVNDVFSKRLGLALSAVGWVGSRGGDSQTSMGPLSVDRRNSVSEEKIASPTFGGLLVAGFLSVNDVSAKRLVFALSAPG